VLTPFHGSKAVDFEDAGQNVRTQIRRMRDQSRSRMIVFRDVKVRLLRPMMAVKCIHSIALKAVSLAIMIDRGSAVCSKLPANFWLLKTDLMWDIFHFPNGPLIDHFFFSC